MQCLIRSLARSAQLGLSRRPRSQLLCARTHPAQQPAASQPGALMHAAAGRRLAHTSSSCSCAMHSRQAAPRATSARPQGLHRGRPWLPQHQQQHAAAVACRPQQRVLPRPAAQPAHREAGLCCHSRRALPVWGPVPRQPQQHAGRSATAAAAAALSTSNSDSDGEAGANDDIIEWATESFRQDNELPWNEPGEWLMPPEEAAHWRGLLDQLQKPVAKQLAEQLDLRYRQGMSGIFRSDEKGGGGSGSRRRGSSSSSSSAGAAGEAPSKPNGWDYFKKAKVKHPDAISLVRVGAFYETVGIDAVLLMEVCSLNPMGGRAQAGCPVANLDAVLKQLVQDRGFAVSVWEEAPSSKKYGSRNNAPKLRWNTQLVTPENPEYLYNFAESTVDRDFDTPALVGVAWTSSGLSVYALNPTNRTIRVYEGLSEDGVWGVIMADRSSKPVVFQHKPPDLPRHNLRTAASAMHREVLDLPKRFGSADVVWRTYTHTQPLEGFRTAVTKALGWQPGTQLHAVPAYEGADFPGVRPLYFSTASQLGLLATRGIPGLVDLCVTDEAPKAVRDVVSGLLVGPPPHAVATATRRAVRRLLSCSDTLPLYLATGVTTPKKITVVLDAKEGNEKFFQGLLGMLLPIIDSLQEGRPASLAGLIDDAWPLLQHTLTSPSITQQQVLEAAADAAKRIQEVVASTSHLRVFYEAPATAGNHGSTGPVEGGAAAAVAAAARPAAQGASRGSSPEATSSSSSSAFFYDAANDACEKLAEKVELWSCKVQAAALGELADKVAHTYDDLVTVCEALLQAATQAAEAKAGPLKAKDRPALTCDVNNESVWLRLPTDVSRRALRDAKLRLRLEDGSALDLPPQALGTPYDRNGARVKGEALFTCDTLGCSLKAYRDAVTAANAAAIQALRDLSCQLSGSREQLAAAAQLGILLTALLDHTRAAGNASWSVPLVGSEEQQQQQQQQQAAAAAAAPGGAAPDGSSSGSVSLDGAGAFRLEGLWPYWMPGSDPSTVKNDVALDGIMLLTGPNMAGKSTVLRSLAAAALLGSVGLCIPAAPGSLLPHLDAVILRTFSGDAPQEGLSAYGVEMKEMGFVLADVRTSSLVLVDELGKGTEVISGTALASGILRQLAAAGARGVFATHLHLLVDLLARVPRITPHRMEVVEESGAAGDAARGGSLSASNSSSSSSSSIGGCYHLRPTWRILPGHCFESLAFTVAQQQGLPAHVLQAAEQDYHHIVHDMGSYAALTGVLRRDVQGGGDQNSGDGSDGSSSSDSSGRSTRTSGSSTGSNDSSGSAARGAAHMLSCMSSSSSSSEDEAAGEDTAGSQGAHVAAVDPPPGRSRRLRRLANSSSSVTSSSGSSGSSRYAWSHAHAASRDALLRLLQGDFGFDSSRLLGAGAAALAPAASAGSQDARQPGAAPAAAQGEQQPLALSGSVAGNAGVQPGVVHELLGSTQPPPAHDGQPAVYALLFDDGLWYVGETQNVRKRSKQHETRRGRKREVCVWYVLLGPGQERRVVQGQLIRAMEAAGFAMLSNHDAAMARRK